MVKTTAENLSPTRVKLAVEVPFQEVKPALDKAYKDIANQVQIPGFRQGKVPARLIDQRFGREVVMDTAVNEGLNTWFQQAVAEAEVTPISRPEVDVTGTPGEKGEDPVTFTAEFDVRPEIELPDYKGLKVTVEPSAATEDDDAEEDVESDRRVTRTRARIMAGQRIDFGFCTGARILRHRGMPMYALANASEDELYRNMSAAGIRVMAPFPLRQIRVRFLVRVLSDLPAASVSTHIAPLRSGRCPMIRTRRS